MTDQCGNNSAGEWLQHSSRLYWWINRVQFENQRMTCKLLVFSILLSPIFSLRIHKCCRLGQLLSGADCHGMLSGTALPKIRVGDQWLSFKELKDKKRLREAAKPKCRHQEQKILNFTTTSHLVGEQQYFSSDSIFVDELDFYRPGFYCVDGEEDHIKVILCKGRGESMGECLQEEEKCYDR